MRCRCMILALAIALLFLPISLSDVSGTSTVDINGAQISSFDDSKEVSAGQSYTLTVDVYNGNTDYIVVGASLSETPLSVSLDTKEISVDKNKIGTFIITVNVDRLMNHGNYTFDMKFIVYNFADGTYKEGSMTFAISVSSQFSDGSGYNMILGIFPHLPAPFDEVYITVIITLLIWVGIAAFAVGLLMVAVRLVFRNDKNVRKDIDKVSGAMLTIAIMIHGISNALSVAGASDALIATAKEIAQIIYILTGAGIAWNLYNSAITVGFHKMETQDKLEGVDTSLLPLFRMIGKVVIVIAAASMSLSAFGFDLAAIVASLGVAAMAISLGAQNTLTQFFSGMNLMITRPFKIGDMVSIGSDSNIYEVKKVGMMSSTFKNWANQEYCVIPNGTVIGSKIVNVTSKTMAYKMYLYFYSSYDADIDLAKKVILDTAVKNPNVIIDGSYSYPEVRLNDFGASAIEYRLAVYIHDFRDNVKVTGQLNEAIYTELVKNDISCPYDLWDVTIYKE